MQRFNNLGQRLASRGPELAVQLQWNRDLERPEAFFILRVFPTLPKILFAAHWDILAQNCYTNLLRQTEPEADEKASTFGNTNS
jgi:hypothetical protein